ncbi:MAG: hypothetical protein IKG22_05975 [Atopobiaceae bacterium]|nr:hypothetical protein [Atopobiaceae bacterium]
MNRGELWEAGTPQQIFEHPKRQETYEFVFRVRSWQWGIQDLDYDYHAMMGSLEEFCTRQFLERRIANGCQLMMEELLSQNLIPAAQDRGIENPNLSFTLWVAEGGKSAQLEVDARSYAAAGITFQDMQRYSDSYSHSLLEKMILNYSYEDGILRFTIG